jgi:FixJ family two-component response regulator
MNTDKNDSRRSVHTIAEPTLSGRVGGSDGACGIFACPGRATGPAQLSKRKLVYVVDDDPGMLRGVMRLLREHGYDTVLFHSADAFQRHDNFDAAVCVILDIDLSDESGIEVRHRMTAAGISLPVIFVTGKDNHATRMAALASGCIAYLTKPFSAKSLIEPIERACARFA